jgi:hypothetical protein
VSVDSVIPKRRFGGYRKDDIDQIVADRDRMVRRAEERVHAAEARIAELENQFQLKTAQQTREDTRLQSELVRRLEDERDAARNEASMLRAQLGERGAEVEALGRELSELRSDHEDQARLLAEAREDASLFLTEELQTILSTAKESARKMMDRARADSDHQIHEANRWWGEVKAEVERFGAWREQVEPMLRDLQARVVAVRSSVDLVSGRMQEAVGTMQEALGSIDGGVELLNAAFEVREQGSLQPPDLPDQDASPPAAEGGAADAPAADRPVESGEIHPFDDGQGPGPEGEPAVGDDGDDVDSEKDDDDGPEAYFGDLAIGQNAYDDVYDYLA